MLRDGPPRVLAMCLGDGLALARSARLLADAGFRVATLCPPGSMVESSTHAERRFPLVGRDATSRLRSLTAAFAELRFDLVVPGDGPTAALLRSGLRLMRAGKATGVPEGLEQALERSLGDPSGFEPLDSWIALAEVARGAGFRAPDRSRVVVVSDALRFAERHGYPVDVLAEGPVDATPRRRCAGEHELAEAASHALLQARASGIPVWVAASPVGRRLGCAVVAQRGEAMGLAVYEKAEVDPRDDARATVVVASDSSPLVDAALGLLRRLGFTGLAEIRAVQDDQGGLWFQGLSPSFVAEFDACRAAGFPAGRLLRCLLGEPKPEPWAWPVGDPVALDPEEGLRDRSSRWLRAARRADLADDPGLLERVLASRKEGEPV
ncbi:MAG: hypothetical protein N2109_03005 [Fimbriimonadales bacterium]|nr:hypothetical protein [Fimbriimonadales bacterium]